MFGFHRPTLLMPIKASLKLYSQRLNVVVSFFITYIIASGGGDIPAILQHIPGRLGLIIAPMGGLIAFGVVTYLRLHPQKPKNCPDDADDAGA